MATPALRIVAGAEMGPASAAAHTRTTPDCAGLYLSSLSDRSAKTMAEYLNTAARLLLGVPDMHAVQWATLTQADALTICAGSRDAGHSPNTQRLLRSALRGVLKAAWRAGQIDTDAHARLVDSIPKVRGSRLPAGRALTLDQMGQLLGTVLRDTTPRGRRDAAALVVLFAAGLRCAEAVAVTLADYHPDTGRLTVIGKGDKQRVVYVADPALRGVVDAWLTVRGMDAGPLLSLVDRRGVVQPAEAMQPHSLRVRVKTAATRAGLGRVTPHDLRRTYATALADHQPIDVVQKLMGHHSPTTTARYLRRDEDALAQASKALSLPGIGPATEGTE